MDAMKRGTPSHTKTARLMRRLGCPKYHALGILEGLWHLTAREAERGNIGKLTDEDICTDLGWSGEPKDLIDALVDCGWLDRCDEHRLIIHDWHDHADDATKKRVERSGMGFVRRCPPLSAVVGQNPPPSDKICLPKPKPEPKPVPLGTGVPSEDATESVWTALEAWAVADTSRRGKGIDAVRGERRPLTMAFSAWGNEPDFPGGVPWHAAVVRCCRAAMSGGTRFGDTPTYAIKVINGLLASWREGKPPEPAPGSVNGKYAPKPGPPRPERGVFT